MHKTRRGICYMLLYIQVCEANVVCVQCAAQAERAKTCLWCMHVLVVVVRKVMID